MIHAKDDCSGACPFHVPSDHHMRDWPIVIRETTLVDRTCPHGVGHPDPDSMRYLEATIGGGCWGVHGCDGCCLPKIGAH